MRFGTNTPNQPEKLAMDAWAPPKPGCKRIIVFGLVLLLVASNRSTVGQDTLQSPIQSEEKEGELLDDFDGVRTSMQIVESKSLTKVRRHHRSDHSPYRGRRSELISVVGTRGGERILATHDIQPVAAIPELEFSLRLRGNRVGFQIMARVRLPRSMNDSGEPIAIYVLGDRYSSPNVWQRLTVRAFEKQISNQVRAMRVEHGSYIDPTEAYVDQVVVNAYGGAENNILSIDDLTAFAAVPLASRVEKSQARSPATFHLANYQSPLTMPLPAKATTKKPNPNWIPRVAKHAGESFAELKQFGFNTIQLAGPATVEQQATATKLQMQLVETESTNWHVTSTVDSTRWLTLRDEIRAAVFAGQNGFVYDPEPFAGFDSPYAKAVAQLFNLELSILRPWILQYETNEPIRPTMRHSDFEVRGMASRHAGLIWVSAKPVSDMQTGNRSVRENAIDLPDSQYRDIYHVEPGSLEPARDQRVPGGVRITLNHDKPDGLLLMSSHPQILQAHKEHLRQIEKPYNKLLITVIQHEMLHLDRQLETSISDPKLAGHLRRELHALRGRITPVLESRERLVTYRQLDHVLGQLERVHHLMSAK